MQLPERELPFLDNAGALPEAVAGAPSEALPGHGCQFSVRGSDFAAILEHFCLNSADMVDPAEILCFGANSSDFRHRRGRCSGRQKPHLGIGLSAKKYRRLRHFFSKKVEKVTRFFRGPEIPAP